MSPFSRLSISTPNFHRILFNRLLALILSLISITLFATTLSIYNNRIAPNDSLAPLDDNLLITNSVPIIPCTISIFWCFTQLLLLTRRAFHKRHDEQVTPRALFHPGWEVAIDFLCAVGMIITLVFAGQEVARWKSGEIDDGFGRRKKVDLKACPVVDPATGLLEYWCSGAWNKLLDVQTAGLSVMGTAAGNHFWVVVRASRDLYRMQKLRHAEKLHRKHPEDTDTLKKPTPLCFSNQITDDGIELEKMRVRTAH